MTRISGEWHAENIKAELRKRFGTLRNFAEKINVSPQSISGAISTPNGSSLIELIIARELGVSAHALWPDRWTADHKKIDRSQFRRSHAAGREAA